MSNIKALGDTCLGVNRIAKPAPSKAVHFDPISHVSEDRFWKLAALIQT